MKAGFSRQPRPTRFADICRARHRVVKLLLDDGDEDVDGGGASHLSLHRVLAGAQDMLDAQVLLDPPEEQLDRPAALVERADGQRRQRRVVGQEHLRLARLRVPESNAQRVFGLLPCLPMPIEHHALIPDHTCGAVCGCRIRLPRIHHVGGTGFEGQHVQHVHVVPLDGGLDGSRRRPVEQAQAQIDGAGGVRTPALPPFLMLETQIGTKRYPPADRTNA